MKLIKKGLEKQFSESSILDCFEKVVSKYSERPALRCGDHSTTYRELNEQAANLANFLIDNYAQSSIIPIYGLLGSDLIVAIIGVLKAKMAYTIIDSSTECGLVAEVIKQTQAPVLLALKHDSGFPPLSIPVIEVVSVIHSTVATGRLYHAETITSSDLAYVIFTSGSTGTPKGVMVEHSQLINYTVWAQDTFETNSGNDSILHSPLIFDLQLTAVYPILCGGGCVHIVAPETGIIGFAELLQQDLDFSLVKLTPSHLTVLEKLLKHEGKVKIAASVEHLVVGGEALTYEHLKSWTSLKQIKTIHNHYGPTETTIGCISGQIRGKDLDVPGSMPLGDPIYNVQLYVEEGEDGATKELIVAGRAVARGYLDCDSGNFFKLSSERAYKTGDLILCNNKDIFFAGRIDQELKLRGFRVNPISICQTLRTHPEVEEAIVLPTKTSNNEFLIAYIVQTQTADLENIKDYMKHKLPEHMLPSVYQFIPEIPLTKNNKVDIEALPRPDEIVKHSSEDIDYLQSLIMNIWADTLNIDEDTISLEDNFFVLGGHSIANIRVLQALKKYGFSLPLNALFHNPTVRSLAEYARLNLDNDLEELDILNTIISPLRKTKKGSAPALFCIHPIGGTIDCFKNLAEALEMNVNIYGLQDPHLLSPWKSFNSLVEMAQTYVEAIRLVQKKGPYFLSGYSFGGVVAIEVARQLQEMKEPVEHVFLVDSWWELYQDAMKENVRLFSFSSYLKFIGKAADQFAKDTLFRMYAAERSKLANLVEYEQGIERMDMVNTKITLFKAQTFNVASGLVNYVSGATEEHYNRWDQVIPIEQLQVVNIEGDHNDLLYHPCVLDLAEKMEKAITNIFLEVS